MVTMTMTKDAKASECGIKIDSYVKGETYELSEKTAAAFLRMKVAAIVKEEEGDHDQDKNDAFDPEKTKNPLNTDDSEGDHDDQDDSDQNNPPETEKQRKAREKAEKLALKNQGDK